MQWGGLTREQARQLQADLHKEVQQYSFSFQPWRFLLLGPSSEGSSRRGPLRVNTVTREGEHALHWVGHGAGPH